MLPALTMEEVMKLEGKKNNSLIVLIYSNYYYKSDSKGYASNFISDYFNYFDKKSEEIINFYWIGYGEYQSGVHRDDIPEAGEVGMHFEYNVFKNEENKIVNMIKPQKWNEKGLNIFVFDKTEFVNNSVSGGFHVDVTQNISLNYKTIEQFFELLIELGIQYNSGKYNIYQIYERLSHYVKSDKIIKNIIHINEILQFIISFK